MPRPRLCECGICRRCKHREYMLAYYVRNRDAVCETARRTRERNLEAVREYDRVRGRRPGADHKERARRAVHNAIRRGRMTRDPCEVCGEAKTHAHHDDYSKPLAVRWLCSKCHGIEHRRPIEELRA